MIYGQEPLEKTSPTFFSFVHERQYAAAAVVAAELGRDTQLGSFISLLLFLFSDCDCCISSKFYTKGVAGEADDLLFPFQQ